MGNVSESALPWTPSAGSGASHDQEMYLLSLQVINPCSKVGMNPIPPGPRVRPIPLALGTGLAVVIVQQPVSVSIDVDVADLVAQTLS